MDADELDRATFRVAVNQWFGWYEVSDDAVGGNVYVVQAYR